MGPESSLPATGHFLVPDESIPHRHTPIIYILTLSYHLSLGLPSSQSLAFRFFQCKFCHVSLMLSTDSDHLILLDFDDHFNNIWWRLQSSWDMRFSQRWLRRVVSSGIWRRVVRCSACCLLHAGFLLGLLYSPEDRGDVFLPNIGWLSTDYSALYPRRHNSSVQLRHNH
jgi:hypothetical protein